MGVSQAKISEMGLRFDGSHLVPLTVGTEFLTAIHCLIMQDCFIRPGPPNFFMSLQK